MADSSDEQPAIKVHSHARKGDTDSWTKSSTVIWRLLEASGVVGLAIFGALWTSANATKDAVATHDGDIKVIKTKIEAHDKTIQDIHQEQIDTNRKIDKILIYHGIQDDKK